MDCGFKHLSLALLAGSLRLGKCNSLGPYTHEEDPEHAPDNELSTPLANGL